METLLIRVGPAGRLAWELADAAPAGPVRAENTCIPDTIVLGARRPARRFPLRDPALATLAAEDIFGGTSPAAADRGKP